MMNMVNFLSTLERIKKNDHELTEVNFNLYKIEDAGAQDLANAFSNNNTLTSLSLGGNKITDAGAQALADSLVNNKTLTNFNISHNEIGALGTQALADSLVNNKTLTNFNIRYNEIGDGGAQALADALVNSKTLTSLDISHNEIGALGTQALADSLVKNKTLTNLDISYNEIGAGGAQVLADAIKNIETLTSLDLSDNQIGDEGAKRLAEALKHNKILKSLNLSGNQITDVGAQDLEYALKDNIILSELRLDDNIRSNNLASIKNLIIRNKELPGKIVEKIYQSFVQNEQAHIAPPKPVLLDPIERKLIAISPNACVEILKELLKKDGISKKDPEAIINHIKNFDGKGASGSRILISSLESKELESFFNLKERLSLADVFKVKGVTKDFGSGGVEGRLPSNLSEMSKDGLSAIFKQLSGDTHPLNHSKLSNDPPSNSRD